MADICECVPGAGADTCELRVLTALNPVCPTNGKAGKRVDAQTIKSLLALPLSELRSDQYFFCRAGDCPTVYYSEDGAQIFEENDLRERVYQKHTADERVLICYCFRYTPAAIRQELRDTGNSTVAASIIDGIQAEQCACDIRNPQGSCCLGNVNSFVKSLQVR
jgi:hypothetical protein